MTDQADRINELEQAAQLLRHRIETLEQALRASLDVIEGLAGQQAMPDDSWQSAYDAARTTLGTHADAD